MKPMVGVGANVASSGTFVSFGLIHAFACVVALALAVGVPVLAARHVSPRQSSCLQLGLAGLILVHLCLNMWVHAGLYGERLLENLPLHLCGASLALNTAVLVTGNYRAYELAYFWSIGGGIPAILMPDVAYSFPHPFFMLFFSGHCLSIMSILYATIVMGMRPRPGAIVRTILVTAAYATVILPVNYLFGSNYLYLRHKPAQPSVADILGPWPWYIGGLAVLAVGIAIICYLPFAFASHRGSSRQGN